jgi:methionyl-tRNA formyltransferase
MPLRLIFMGTPEFSVPTLLELVAHGHEIAAVYTRAAKPGGRGMKLQPTPVEQEARRLGIAVITPRTLKTPEALAEFSAHHADAAVVVAYGMILPQAILDAPRLGCFNLHASLLPRWRGAAPIQYAILHGDHETGVTTMYMDEHMDTGDIILQRAQLIHVDDTSATLHDRLAKLGADLLVETVSLIAEGKAPRAKQDETRATYAKKITKDDGRIDWTRSAVEIERQVRAFNPWPGTHTRLGDLLLKVWKIEVVEGVSGNPGELLSGFIVATSQGGVRIQELQPANSKRMPVDAFLRGHEIRVGSVLG